MLGATARPENLQVRKLPGDSSGEAATLCRFVQVGAAQHDVGDASRTEQPKRLLAIDGLDHAIVTAAQVGRDFNARRGIGLDKENGARLAATGEPNDIAHTSVTAAALA